VGTVPSAWPRRGFRFVVPLLALAGCIQNPVQPEPTLAPAGNGKEQQLLRDFTAVLDLTDRIAATAMKAPSGGELVDVELAAMQAHVQARTGRTPQLPPGVVDPNGDPRFRLAEGAIALLPELDIDSGEAELARVAARALAVRLGTDAEFRDESPFDDSPVTFGAELSDGIGVLRIRSLTDDVGDRAVAALNQWASQTPPLRALLLDLSSCRRADPTATLTLMNALAPGRTVFQVEFKNGAGQYERREWRTDADWGVAAVARIPLFLWVSSRTAGRLEAAALMLRDERGAQLLGQKTAGSGVVQHWYPVPGGRWLGFAAAYLFDAHGQPLQNRPVFPDACPVGGNFSVLHDRAAGGYESECGNPSAAPELPAALRYVAAATVDSAPPSAPATPAPAAPPKMR